MTGKSAKAIRRYMKEELKMTPDNPDDKTKLITVRVDQRPVKVPARTVLGKVDLTAGFKTEFVDVPVQQAFNPYRRIFKAIQEGRWDFETKTVV